ncbi:mitochondrial fission process protein 1-like [Montipora capricornis]|uniref:mitochondrial fission process protein 1-like n=1 Tax=Montipora capricornis TaxID=246305 RepID=UPI0035F1AE65
MTRQWDKDGMADQEEISNIRTVRDVDIYRDTPLRYLGYANEFGEAFRSHIPRLIYFGSYAVASTYCLADSIDKGRRCYQQSSHLNSYLQKRKAAETAVEAAIWQGLASVIIPGFTINRICAASRFTLRRFVHRMPHGAQMWVTTVIGLSAIPIIIKPIDRLVDHVMDGLIEVSRKLGISHQLDHSQK